MRRLPLLLLLPLLTALSAAARSPLAGQATADSAPVAHATVVLLRAGRQQAGTTTDTAGRFRLEVDTGRYLLSLRHVAYRTLERTVEVRPGGTDLGMLRLVPNGIAAVSVEAAAVRRETDRFVVEVHDTPAMAGRDGAELLTLAPGVHLGSDGITINGAGGTRLYVDGREVKGSAEQISAYLRSLTADDVARIEVVPQTGAEFAAETRGGVILITLRRRRTEGLDGSVQLSASLGRDLRAYAPSARIRVRTGRWTLGAGASGTFAPDMQSRFTESRTYVSEHRPFASAMRTGGRSNYGRGEFSAFWDPSPRHTAGFSAEYVAQGTHQPTEARTTLGSDVSASRYRKHANSGMLTLTANYLWRIDTLGSELRLIADYTRQEGDGEDRYRTLFTAPGTQRDTLYRSAARSRYDILTAELALTRKLPHALTLDAGVRYTRNGTDDRSRYEAARQTDWQPLPAYGYDRRHTEQTGAAFASLGFSRGRWEVKAGLRGEYTLLTSRDVRQEYFALFPSVSVNRSLNALRTWMLVAQWSRNIERPTFPALNPAREQLSEYSYQAGNPALRPTYIHRLSLTAVWRYRYTLTVGGNLHRDLMREVAGIDAENPDILAIRPENHHTENHWFAALSAPLRLAQRVNLTLNAVGVVQRIRLDRHDDAATHGLLFADATLAVTLPQQFHLEAVYRVQSRLYSGNSQVGPRQTLAASIRKRCFGKRLTLFLTAENLTGTSWEFVSETAGTRRVMRGRIPWTGRQWKLGATWNFRAGKELRNRSVERAADTERRRLTKNPDQSK